MLSHRKYLENMNRQMRSTSSKQRLLSTVLLAILVLALGVFLVLGANWDTSPQETIKRLTGQAESAAPPPAAEVRGLSDDNAGILTRLDQAESQREDPPKQELITALGDVIGVQMLTARGKDYRPSGFEPVDSVAVGEGVRCEVVTFLAYDDLKVPVYVLRPSTFSPDSTYPAVLLYSGHGNAAQAAFDTSSYQKGAGVELARNGFIVYVMENRGMGRLAHLGDHLRIDAVARLTGGSWYGEIVTDALFLLENVLSEPFVDRSRIGAAGVSTGGALSMFVAAFDDRVTATYVQGFLGSFGTTFGRAGGHCLCGHISGILEVGDMADIASLIAPRPVCFVNGSEDTFGPTDAREAFATIDEFYATHRAGGKAVLLTPEGVGHEFSIDLALPWLKDKLR